jgi:hypothetical protein
MAISTRSREGQIANDNDENELLPANCNYPGCGKVVMAKPVFLAPPSGWWWCEPGGIGGHKDGLYCAEHGEEIERLIRESL